LCCEKRTRPLSLQGPKRALHTLKRDLHTLKRALHTLKRALHTLTRALQTPKRALHTLERALHTLERALHTLKRALLVLWEMKKAAVCKSEAKEGNDVSWKRKEMSVNKNNKREQDICKGA